MLESNPVNIALIIIYALSNMNLKEKKTLKKVQVLDSQESIYKYLTQNSKVCKQ